MSTQIPNHSTVELDGAIEATSDLVVDLRFMEGVTNPIEGIYNAKAAGYAAKLIFEVMYRMANLPRDFDTERFISIMDEIRGDMGIERHANPTTSVEEH